MTRTLALAVVSAAALLSGCDGIGDDPKAAFTRPLAGNVGGVNGSWTTGVGGYQLVYSIQEAEGQAAVCGLYRFTGGDNSSVSRKVISDYQVVVGDTVLMQDLLYFTRVETEDALFSTPANCALTGIPWEDRFLSDDAELTGARRQYRL